MIAPSDRLAVTVAEGAALIKALLIEHFSGALEVSVRRVYEHRVTTRQRGRHHDRPLPRWSDGRRAKTTPVGRPPTPRAPGTVRADRPGAPTGPGIFRSNFPDPSTDTPMPPPKKKKRRPANRSKSSYLSRDPVKRANQLRNLPSGGNTAHVGRAARTHGAYAMVVQSELDEKTAEIFSALAEDTPVKENGALPAADTVAVMELARALILRDRFADYLQRRGFEDEHGNPRPVLSELAKHNAHILNVLEALGMTPRARAQLGLDLIKGLSAAEEFQAFLGGHREHDDGVVDG